MELPLSLPQFLTVALSLTEVLDQIHSKNIAFGALCPLTTWFDPKGEQCYMIDFCWCQVNNLIGNEEDIEWSNVIPESLLPYIAPEHIRQSRIGNSGFRADLYSLGIILFELITGRLPFDCTDKEELLHAHLAKNPHLANEISIDVPPIIASIIDKLLQKEPVQRYATAHGVFADLSLCKEYASIAKDWDTSIENSISKGKKILKQLKEEHDNEKTITQISIPEFELGRHDVADTFAIPNCLYGRKKYIKSICNIFNQIEEKGGREIIILKGTSGSGKTALISKVVKQLQLDTWFCISMEFGKTETVGTLSKNSEYLQTLFSRSAVQSQTIGQQILSRSKFEVDQWRDKLSNILVDGGDILLKYIPSLKDVVGPITPLKKELSTIEQTRMLSRLLCKFITSLGGPGHPLLVVLDSMQWASQQMLQLFKNLSALPGLSYIVFILAYRTEDSQLSNGNIKLKKILKHCEERNMPVTTLNLENLNIQNIKEMIEDSISVAPTDSLLPLAENIFKKTNGNPLFVSQFLRSLYQEKLLRFDDLQRKWMWDSDKIQRKPYTPNVIEFMLQEIDKLSFKQKELLQIAACIGNEFDLLTITELILQLPSDRNIIEKKTKSPNSKRPRTTIVKKNSIEKENNEEKSDLLKSESILKRCLLIAERDLLIVMINQEYDDEIKGFAFAHERIHRAAYLSLPPESTSKIHLSIGKFWLSEHLEGPNSKDIPSYKIVNQLNQGRYYIKDNELLMNLILYNQIIANNAIQEGAYDQGVECAIVAQELLIETSGGSELAWKLHHTLMMEFSSIIYSYSPDGENTELFNTLISKSRSKLEIVQLYYSKVDHHRKDNDFQNAILVTKECIEKILKVSLKNPSSILDLKKMNENLKNIWKIDNGNILESNQPTHPIPTFNGEKYVEEHKSLRNLLLKLLNRCIDLSLQMDLLTVIQLSIQSTIWSVQWGFISDSLPGLIMYGVSCIHLFNDIEYSKMIEKLLEQLDMRFPESHYLIIQSRLQWFNFWNDIPLSQGIKPMNCIEEELWDCYRDFLSRGQTIQASHTIGILACNSFYTCENLEQCKEVLTTGIQFLSKPNSPGEIVLYSILECIDSLSINNNNNNNNIQNIKLSNLDNIDDDNNNNNINYTNILSNIDIDSNPQSCALHYLMKMGTSYILNENSQSHKCMILVEKYNEQLFGRVEKFYYHFWSALIQCRTIESYNRIHNSSSADNSSGENINSYMMNESLDKIHEHIFEMKKWKQYSPINFSHSVDLIIAEVTKLSGKEEDALSLYRTAISNARRYGYILIEAIGHELLGNLMSNLGKQASARYSILDAIRCFKEYGANQKVIKLETIFRKKFTDQFPTLIQNESISGNKNSITGGSSNVELTSDNFQKIEKQLKLIQLITEELQSSISLGGSLQRIWKEICVFSGAQRGCLALYRNRELELEIDGGTNDRIQVLHSLINTNQYYCARVMNYVTTARSPVIISDCQSDSAFLGDAYVRKKKLKSLFCIPILLHNQIIGVLYLENSLISGLFSDDIIPIMTTISHQLAISIKNEYLSYSLQRQMIENRNNINGNGSNQIKCKAFRRIDHLLGYSWEKCILVLTENHFLVKAPVSGYKTVPLARYEIGDIKEVDQVDSKDIQDSSQIPTKFIMRLFINGSKVKVYFALQDLRTVKEWIKYVSGAIKQLPDKISSTSQLLERNIKIWEDEIQLDNTIGEGGTAHIFSATWHGMRVAVKRFHESSDEAKDEFIKEVKILQNLRHPSVILFIGAYFTKLGPCLVTELMKSDLHDYIKNESNEISLNQKLQWVKDIVNGMIYLHSFEPPIIHRDLKTVNILLDENLNAKIADLGLAKHIHTNMTKDLGTPAWMAPEVFQGQEYTTSADGKFIYLF